MTKLKAWLLIAPICLALPTADYFHRGMRVKLSLPGTMFVSCGLAAVLAVVLGVIGGRTRDWKVTAGGSLLFCLMIPLCDCLNGTPRFTGDDFIFLLIFFPVVLAGALVGHAGFTAMQRQRMTGRCQKCGYDLYGNVSGICPECGTPTKPSVPASDGA